MNVVFGKRTIGLGLCLFSLFAGGIVSHYLFRLLGLQRSIEVFGFSLDLVAVAATVIGLAAVGALARPVDPLSTSGRE